MLRILEARIMTEDGKQYIRGACLAADVAGLATTGLVTGSQVTVADTGDVYMFAEGDSPAWNKIAAGPTAAES